MGNVAAIIPFPTQRTPEQPQEVRVAELDNGFLRLASELVEEVAKQRYGVTAREFRVLMVVSRKTYGFNKKLDWVSGAQLAEATEMTENQARDAVRTLVGRRILMREGRRIGWNTTISEWKTKQPHSEGNNPKSGSKNNPEMGSRTTSNRGHTKDNIQKTRKTKDHNTSAEPAVADSTPVVIDPVAATPVTHPNPPAQPQPTAQPVPAEPVVITMPLNSGAEHAVTESFAAQMQALYPAVNVAQELRTMCGWLVANPTRRKTKSGITRFINAWLAKCQDRGGRSDLPGYRPRGGEHTDLTQSMTAEELNRRIQEGF